MQTSPYPVSERSFWESLKRFDYKGATLVLSLLSGMMVLYMDRHNDERYLSIGKYKDDDARLNNTLVELKDGQRQIIAYLLETKQKERKQYDR
jgi:hypothetical protein